MDQNMDGVKMDDQKTEKNYCFCIRRKYDSPIEQIVIKAQNSHEALGKLPKCFSFYRTEKGKIG